MAIHLCLRRMGNIRTTTKTEWTESDGAKVDGSEASLIIQPENHHQIFFSFIFDSAAQCNGCNHYPMLTGVDFRFVPHLLHFSSMG